MLRPEKPAVDQPALSLVVYAVAIPLAFAHAHIAFGVMALVTVIWITPMAGIKSAAEPPGG